MTRSRTRIPRPIGALIAIGVTIGFLVALILTLAEILPQKYLSLGMFRISADVLRRELTRAVLVLVPVILAAVALWKLLARRGDPGRRAGAALAVGLGMTGLTLVVFGRRLELALQSVNGVDGTGTITPGFLVGKLSEPGLVVPVAAVLAAGLVGLWLAAPGVAHLGGWVRDRAPARLVGLARVAAPVVVVLALVLNVWPGLARQRGGWRPSIILVSIDTLRADRLGCYGNHRGLTPNLDRLAGESVLFESCFSQVPFTLPSHMTMLTSLYPHVHGVNEERALHPSVVTLAEALRNQGYATVGVTRSITWMDGRFGFVQGFDRYVCRTFREDAAVENRTVADQLRDIRGRPFFLFVHYFDPHSDFVRMPYDAPGPYLDRFAIDSETPFDGGADGRYASEFLKDVNERGVALAPDVRAHIASLYDAGVAYTDACIGELRGLLESEGLLDQALLVIVGDHGEEFQEHGYMLHSNPLHHREILQVPFLVRFPDGTGGGRRVSSVVELVDLMPTVLDYAGAPTTPMAQGESLLPFVDGSAQPAAVEGRAAISVQGRSASITTGRWRLLSQDADGTPRHLLYDRVADPGETRDVSLANREVVLDLLGRARDILSGAGGPAGGSVDLSEEKRRQLRSLGYLD